MSTFQPAPAAPWIEPFQPQDLVITLLGSYVRPHHEMVWSGGIVELLGEFGFSTGAARVALTRLVRRDLIARVRQGRLIHYRLTPRSEALLAEGDQRIFALGRDVEIAATWTMLWHAIPEERRLERARLARRLRFLGFGSVHDGMWISPHDREDEVTRLVAELDIREFAGVLVGRSARALDIRPLVERAWDLPALAERYRAFADEFSAYRTGAAQRRLDDRAAFLLRTRLVHVFRGFPFLDPELPDELMPAPEERARAIAVFHIVYEALDEPSQRHFSRVTRPRDAAASVRGRV